MGTLDSFRRSGKYNDQALNIFGVNRRSRAYVRDIYGLPLAAAGAAQIGGPEGPPWWWDSSERGPYMSTAAWGPASWLPKRPERLPARLRAMPAWVTSWRSSHLGAAIHCESTLSE